MPPDPIGDRIVKAAADAFGRHGFAGASTATIARQARTSKREIYDRFPGKDALFEEVMKYLCGLGASESEASKTSTEFSDDLRNVAKAVLTRFSLPETRGVLAAAIGATSQYPSVLAIFWQQGPGQAVDYIASELEKRFASGDMENADFREIATDYIHECCGPVVLHQIFDFEFEADSAQIDRCIDTAIANLESRLNL